MKGFCKKAFASCPEGLEDLLAEEINNLGGVNITSSKRFVFFECSIDIFYRLHFRSRIAFRFYREITRFTCTDKYNLYKGVQSSFDWATWITPEKTFSVKVTGKTGQLRHSHFTALEVKNAIVDLQQAVFKQRSSVSKTKPDLIIHVHLYNSTAILSLQGTIDSLHKRGYRPAMADASLKENLAAGLMKFTEWNGEKPLIDLMCGSGTFLIEGILQNLNEPLVKEHYLFQNWYDFKEEIFLSERSKIIKEYYVKKKISKVIGCEINQFIYNQAKENILLAGVADYIDLYNINFSNLDIKNISSEGIIICNPPYGKRLGDEEELIDLYRSIGNYLKKNFSGWTFWLLSGNSYLTQYLKMKSSLKIPVSNGGIDCRWIKYKIK